MRLSLKFFLICMLTFTTLTGIAQNNTGTSQNFSDSPKNIVKVQKPGFIDSLFKKNKYLNYTSPPAFAINKQRVSGGKEFLFYFIGTFIFLVACFKAFYSKYFNNIFRVFFNTSLRQNQITDQLLQAKLPSLIFNIFFVISAGVYAWLLLKHYQIIEVDNVYISIALSVLTVGLIYTGKFFALKFVGWISGMSDATDKYIFVIFLINKIIGIILIPFIIMLAFAPPPFFPIVALISFLFLGSFFLLRYLRSYGLLQNQLRLSRFHFFIYMMCVEIVPFLILFKLIGKIFFK